MDKRDMLFWGLSFALIVLVACNLNLSNTGFGAYGTFSDGGSTVDPECIDDVDQTYDFSPFYPDVNDEEAKQSFLVKYETYGLDWRIEDPEERERSPAITRWDDCNPDGTLKEHYCQHDLVINHWDIDCEEYFGEGYICQNGACVEPEYEEVINPECGIVIEDEYTKVFLTEDMDCQGLDLVEAIRVRADNVEIDCQGNYILMDSTSETNSNNLEQLELAVSTRPERPQDRDPRNLFIHDCKIQGSLMPARVDSRIQGNEIYNCGVGISSWLNENLIVQDNYIHDCAIGYNVQVPGGDDERVNEIRNNEFCGNDLDISGLTWSLLHVAYKGYDNTCDMVENWVDETSNEGCTNSCSPQPEPTGCPWDCEGAITLTLQSQNTVEIEVGGEPVVISGFEVDDFEVDDDLPMAILQINGDAYTLLEGACSVPNADSTFIVCLDEITEDEEIKVTFGPYPIPAEPLLVKDVLKQDGLPEASSFYDLGIYQVSLSFTHEDAVEYQEMFGYSFITAPSLYGNSFSDLASVESAKHLQLRYSLASNGFFC